MSFYSFREKNIRKSLVLLSLFLVIILLSGWFLGSVFRKPLIFWIALLFSFFSSVGSWLYSHKLVLAGTGAVPLEREKAPHIYSLLENLCKVANMPLPKLYVIETPVMNAFATGPSPKKSYIVLTRGLIDNLDRSELEGVLAHELSHIYHRDTLFMTLVVVLLGTLLTIWDFFVRGWFYVSDDDKDVPPLVYIVGFLFLLLAPVLGYLIQFAISRKREFMADSQAVLWTRYPQGLIRALQKIAGSNHTLSTRNSLVSALLIHSSSRQTRTKKVFAFINRLFSTHPPVEERIKALENFGEV